MKFEVVGQKLFPMRSGIANRAKCWKYERAQNLLKGVRTAVLPDEIPDHWLRIQMSSNSDWDFWRN